MELMNVVWNILCKLPLKSLKRFQSASKSWHDFIHDPEFISQHLHVFNSSRKYQNILDGGSDDQHLHPDGVCAIRPTPTSRFHNIVAYIDLLNLDETSGEVSSRRLLNLPQYDKVQAPFPIMFGPCNGIYCLHHASYLVDDIFHVIILINVSLRELKLVAEPDTPPPPPVGFQQFYATFCVGFGYDPKTNDYKFVLVRVCYEDSWKFDDCDAGWPCDCRVMRSKTRKCTLWWHTERKHYTSQIVIYSLSSKSWKNSDDYVHDINLVGLEHVLVEPGDFQYSTYVDGICYWWIYSDNLTSVQVAESGDYWILLYFNLVDQVLGQIMLPPEMVVFRSPNPVASDKILSSTDGSLSVYGGSLYVSVYYKLL